jgi:hypothetical protein
MNTKRLLILAAFLETVPEHKFDLSFWRWSYEIDENSVSLSELNASLSNESLISQSCGTTGCAIGWACTIPEFIEDGFTWSRNYPLLTNRDKEWCKWDAIQEFFSIDGNTAEYLFMDAYYYYNKSGSKDVANRIREVVSKFNKE